MLNAAGLVLVALVIIGALYGTFSQRSGLTRPPATTGPPGSPTAQSQPPAQSPAPMTAPATVPPSFQVQPPMPAATPAAPARQGAPWEFDPVTNMHWDPRPGHEHWHSGAPPD